jgi:hypothetical protein
MTAGWATSGRSGTQCGTPEVIVREFGPREVCAVEKTSLWNRVGDWFRTTGRFDGDGGVAEGAAAGGVDDAMVPASRTVAARRETPVRERVEDGFTKVVELVESIQGHLEAQDGRAERIVDSLQRIAEGLSPLSERAQAQIDTLEEIRRHLEDEATRLRRLEESLSQLPSLADAQRETMVAVGRQLDELRTAGDRNATSLSSVGDALSGLQESTGAANDVLREVHRDSLSREDRLTDLLRNQNHRLKLFAYAAIAMAAVVSLACVAALLR